MENLHWLLTHAAALAFFGGLLEVKALLVVGGWAAQQGDAPLGMVLLFAFQGCALGEPLLIWLRLQRGHLSLSLGFRVARYFGLVWWLLRSWRRRWSLTFLNFSGALLLSVSGVSVGYALAGVLSVFELDLHHHEGTLVLVLALAEVAMRLHAIRQSRRNETDGDA